MRGLQSLEHLTNGSLLCIEKEDFKEASYELAEGFERNTLAYIAARSLFGIQRLTNLILSGLLILPGGMNTDPESATSGGNICYLPH